VPKRALTNWRCTARAGYVRYFDCNWHKQHQKAEPLSFGTVKSSLFPVLADDNHQKVKLSDNELRAIKCWIDLNCPLWGDYLYDASGNAVSKDKEVGPPRSFRWWAPPRHLRSHNYSSSFTGLVSAGGRVFYILDEGTFLFDKGGATEKFALIARDAFNGAFLWKKALEGYGQPFYEDVSGQAVNDSIWRSPLSMNRRVVAIGERKNLVLRLTGEAKCLAAQPARQPADYRR